MSSGFGDSQTASFVFNEGKSSIHVRSTNWNKIVTSDFGPVTVTGCETALFFVSHYFMGCNKQIVNTALTDRLTGLTGKSGLLT